LNTTFTGTVGPVPFSKTINLEQDNWGGGDLIPQFAVRWNAGVNNYMAYLTGDIPVGLYSSSNLANIGLGHGALDGGGTNFQWSLDSLETSQIPRRTTRAGSIGILIGGASQFLSKQLLVGLVGYMYDQFTPDSGCAPALCPFESRVITVGPQIGYIFPAGHDMQGYINLKFYGEFDNANPPDGWNVWLTFVLSPAPPATQTAEKPMVTK
jgi:hypothetical protein